ncbi:hypothetical protein K438DRAFT_2003214 [Mycena galopus ATCC 62051]|nr:hypothetical protein K438DRAFT_2003214 [Mycena galopus ATCC 62051]
MTMLANAQSPILASRNCRASIPALPNEMRGASKAWNSRHPWAKRACSLCVLDSPLPSSPCRFASLWTCLRRLAAYQVSPLLTIASQGADDDLVLQLQLHLVLLAGAVRVPLVCHYVLQRSIYQQGTRDLVPAKSYYSPTLSYRIHPTRPCSSPYHTLLGTPRFTLHFGDGGERLTTRRYTNGGGSWCDFWDCIGAATVPTPPSATTVRRLTTENERINLHPKAGSKILRRVPRCALEMTSGSEVYIFFPTQSIHKAPGLAPPLWENPLKTERDVPDARLRKEASLISIRVLRHDIDARTRTSRSARATKGVSRGIHQLVPAAAAANEALSPCPESRCDMSSIAQGGPSPPIRLLVVQALSPSERTTAERCRAGQQGLRETESGQQAEGRERLAVVWTARGVSRPSAFSGASAVSERNVEPPYRRSRFHVPGWTSECLVYRALCITHCFILLQGIETGNGTFRARSGTKESRRRASASYGGGSRPIALLFIERVGCISFPSLPSFPPVD